LKTPIHLHKILEKLYEIFDRYGHKIKTFRLDAQFMTEAIDSLTATRQTKLDFSAPGEHSQNGAAERLMQTLQRRITANMANYEETPAECWGYCALDVGEALGMQPTQKTGDKTPDELFYGTKPDISKHMMLPFSLPVRARLAPLDIDNKLSSRAFKGIVVGTQRGTKMAPLISRRTYVRRSFTPFGPPEIYKGYFRQSDSTEENDEEIEVEEIRDKMTNELLSLIH
jgi:hypothetical protein